MSSSDEEDNGTPQQGAREAAVAKLVQASVGRAGGVKAAGGPRTVFAEAEFWAQIGTNVSGLLERIQTLRPSAPTGGGVDSFAAAIEHLRSASKAIESGQEALMARAEAKQTSKAARPRLLAPESNRNRRISQLFRGLGDPPPVLDSTPLTATTPAAVVAPTTTAPSSSAAPTAAAGEKKAPLVVAPPRRDLATAQPIGAPQAASAVSSSTSPAPVSSEQGVENRSRSNGALERQVSHRRLLGTVSKNSVLVKRGQILRELLSTETTYVQQLDVLVNNYKQPFEENVAALEVSRKHLDTMFGNADEILSQQEAFLRRLRYCMGEGTAKPEPVPASDDADDRDPVVALKQHVEAVEGLYLKYVQNYDNALVCYEHCQRSDMFSRVVGSLQLSLMESRQGTIDMDLNSLMMTPVQRLPRYLLLLRELAKYTPPQVPDYAAVKEAASSVTAVLDRINRSPQDHEAESLRRILEIQRDIDGDFLNLVEPHRRFVRQGDLVALWDEAGSGGGLWSSLNQKGGAEYTFFLFNDLILYATRKKKVGNNGARYEYKGYFLMMAGVQAFAVPGDKLFEIVLAPSVADGAAEVYRIAAKSPDEAEAWALAVREQCQRAREDESGGGTDLFKESDYEGYLLKRGESVKNWRRRYFRLRGDVLYYYSSSQEGSRLLGSLPLDGYSIHLAERKLRKPNSFELRHTSRRCFYFQADTAVGMKEWISALFFTCADIDPELCDSFFHPVQAATRSSIVPSSSSDPASDGLIRSHALTLPGGD